jgi:N4-gp56 family major capsid protein
MSNTVTTAVQTGSGLSKLTGAVLRVYSKDLMFEALPLLKFDQFAEEKTELGKQPGDGIVFFKFNNLTRGGKLTEGTAMTKQALSGSQITITVDEWGNAVSMSELLVQTSFINVMETAATQLGTDYAMTVDEEHRDVLETTVNSVIAGDRADIDSITTADIMSVEEVKDAVEVLATNNVPKIGGDHYACFVSPHQSRDLRDDTNWITVGKLDPQRLYYGEIGRIDDVIFIETTQVSTADNEAATPVEYHTALMLGANALGRAVALPVEMRDDGVEDFKRKHSIAWYSIFGCGIINANNIVAIYTA